MTTTTNHIEKKIHLRATRARVWRALSDAAEFGHWFGVRFDGTFQIGKPITGHITTRGYEHVTMVITVERMEPESLFAYRWHPYAIDPTVDYSSEPTTLVEFGLEDAPGGTLLTVTESGFDGIPLHRRDEAFRMNDRGWSAQVDNIRRHVET